MNKVRENFMISTIHLPLLRFALLGARIRFKQADESVSGLGRDEDLRLDAGAEQEGPTLHIRYRRLLRSEQPRCVK